LQVRMVNMSATPDIAQPRLLLPTEKELMELQRMFAFEGSAALLVWRLPESAVLREIRGMAQTVESMAGDLKTVAKGQWELRRENEELKRLAAGGYLDFVRTVDPQDFCCFIHVLAYGDRAKAARKLKMKVRRFYERVDSWATGGARYQRMHALVMCRKRAMRKGTVWLGPSLQSGGTQDAGENPKTMQAVLDQIESGNLDQRNYPQVLQEILNALADMNGENWAVIQDEVMKMIKEEVPQ